MTTTAQTQHSVAELAWIRLMRIYHQVDRSTANLLKPHGLSVSRFDVLAQAGAREGSTQQELADAMFVTKGNICQLIDGMEADGLVYRRRRGRTNLIYLTDEGKQARTQALSDQLTNIEDALGVLSEAETTQLLGLLRKVDKGLNARQKGLFS